MVAELEPVETRPSLRERTRIVIFEADTPAGRAFDVALFSLILGSVIAVMMESVAAVRAAHGPWLRATEWVVTALFTVEYGVRLWCVREPFRYARSFFGVVDLLAILPTYLSLVLPGSQSLLTIRALRLLRIFRVLKLSHFLGDANLLLSALRSGRRKVLVFLGTLLVLALILGSAMHLVEGPTHGFTSIPRSVYWAIVTMTTVGYGDITPQTLPGQILAAGIMILGYSIIAVPTGIFTAEIVAQWRRPVSTRTCPACLTEGHDPKARYCKDCGAPLTGE